MARGSKKKSSKKNGVHSNLDTKHIITERLTKAPLKENGFTLANEARNSWKFRESWSSDTRLRHHKISFVSAGNLESDKIKSIERKHMGLRDTQTKANEEGKVSLGNINLEKRDARDALQRVTSVSNNKRAIGRSQTQPYKAGFVFKEDSSVGFRHVPSRLKKHDSSTSSDSSEDVILFKGRVPKQSAAAPKPQIQISTPLKATEDHLEEISIHGHKSSVTVHSNARFSEPLRVQSLQSLEKRRVFQETQYNNKESSNEVDAEAMEDYIANVAAHIDSSDSNFSTRIEPGVSQLSLHDMHQSSSGKASLIESDDDEGAAHFAVSDSFSKSPCVPDSSKETTVERTVSTGLTSPKLRESQSNKAHVGALSTKIESPKGIQEINAFKKDRFDLNRTAVEDSPSGTITEDADPSEESSTAESVADTFKDDERIARMLALQEEIGFGSDGLLLIDNESSSKIINLQGDESSSRKKETFPLRKSVRQSVHEFPSASLMADVFENDPYGGFDIMDFERPSLQITRKNTRKNRQAPGLSISDDELKAKLDASWASDRSKKNLAKQKRQDLRAQGLLVRKNKFNPNVRVKYGSEISTSQVIEEIRLFLISSDENCTLPPMEKKERAFVHRLALKLGLTSKSIGSGSNRHPTLFRTQKTVKFNESHFEQISNSISMKTINRSKGKIGNLSVAYKDGDVVGATAPELSADNKGRAMLEKMGWSSGMSLGAEDNAEGILQPIAHVVKISRIGLG